MGPVILNSPAPGFLAGCLAAEVVVVEAPVVASLLPLLLPAEVEVVVQHVPGGGGAPVHLVQGQEDRAADHSLFPLPWKEEQEEEQDQEKEDQEKEDDQADTCETNSPHSLSPSFSLMSPLLLMSPHVTHILLHHVSHILLPHVPSPPPSHVKCTCTSRTVVGRQYPQ